MVAGRKENRGREQGRKGKRETKGRVGGVNG